jgi:potassium uptake TrkH family protein
MNLDENKKEVIFKILNIGIVLASLIVIGSMVYEYGFYPDQQERQLLHTIDLLFTWYFTLTVLLRAILLGLNIQFLKSRWFEILLSLIIIFQFFYLMFSTGLSNIFSIEGAFFVHHPAWLLLIQVSILLALISEGASINKRIAQLKLHPSQILLLSFLLIILLGTGLLLLPRATVSGQSMPFIDALFTATSATCVTGLIVVDTGTYFSKFGQLIILFLIQIGGLGIMTFSSFFVLIFRRNISLREKSLVKEILNYDLVGVVNQVLKYSIILTFFLEFIGAISLFLSWRQYYPSTAEAIYSSVFHAVSAFCNAGFSIHSNSLESFRGNSGVLLTISLLIIMGGFGFPVLINVFRLPLFEKINIRLKVYHLHTKLVLTISSILLIAGTLFILPLEWDNTLGQMSFWEKILNAFFQSVTTRTAGFNSIPISQLTVPVLSVFMILMYIGASPGSTGGGIKTTTIGVLFASIKSVIKNKSSIELYKREIPLEVFQRAIIIMLISGLYIFTAFTLLQIFNPFPFAKALFEVFSAFGTVGLSTGITPNLNTIGKIIIIFSMYFGRVGVLTITLAFMRPTDRIQRYHYPRANVMVG